MQERVTLIEGKKPIIFISPHGHPKDDINTGKIASLCAKASNAYAVINNGWKKAPAYDYKAEKADCNDIHQLTDVPGDEFLAPIIKFTNRLKKKFATVQLLYLHGIFNEIRKKVGDNDLAMIIGYGAGFPNSYTCQPWMKDFFCYQAMQYGWHIYESGPGAAYSGWARKNLCQYFRKWRQDDDVHAMQLEITRDWRYDAKCGFISECISDYMLEILNYTYWTKPKYFSVPTF